MKKPLAAILLALSVSLLHPGDGRGQEAPAAPAAEPEEIFFDVTEVDVVNVEVFVTDKKGQRVNGLERDDFEIYENGQLMEISNFYAVENGRPLDSGARIEPLPETPGDLPRFDDSPLPADQRLHLVIYVDNFNLRPANRNRVLHRMSRFLHEKLKRDDRVMVVSYDRSLHVRQPFTSDKMLVADALEGLEELSGIAVLRDAERRKALEEMETERDAFRALQWVRSYADSVYTEMDFTLDGLENHLSALSGLVGRKALLYVSDGLPQIVGEDLFLAVDEKFPRSRARLDAYAYDLAPRFRELVAKANAAGVTFYTLDAGGLQAHSSISAEYGGTRAGGGQAYIDSVRSANLQEPLHMLADDTGGVAIVNTNAIEAGLDRVAEDFSTYYSLGYQPRHHSDGRYYKIDVKVKGKGLTARHRTGYRDRTPEARLTDGSIASLYFGFEINPLDVELEFGNPVPQEGGHFLLPIAAKIPLGRLALAPGEDAYLGRFKVSVVVMDEKGRVSPVQQQEPITVRIPAAEIEQAKNGFYTYSANLMVRKGLIRVAVGVRDELGSETSFLRQTLQVAGA